MTLKRSKCRSLKISSPNDIISTIDSHFYEFTGFCASAGLYGHTFSGGRMTEELRRQITDSVRDFHLPRYREIPDIGLHLEQVTLYISGYLEPVQSEALTGSMISNYVKKHLIDSPRKKQYSRDQIAYLFFIAIAKNVVSLDDLKKYISLQRQTYEAEQAYNYFCDELENILAYVFGLKNSVEDIGTTSSDAKDLLRTLIVAAAYKIYLDRNLNTILQNHEPTNQEDTA